MAAPERYTPQVAGKDIVLRKDVADAVGFIVLDRDDTVRDLTDDTLTVAAKLDTTAKTLTVAADSPTTAGKGTLTIPAAQLGAAGTLYVDIYLAKSGGAANLILAWQFTVEDSSAD